MATKAKPTLDEELQAMQAVLDAMGPLSQEARRRVLAYFDQRFSATVYTVNCSIDNKEWRASETC